MNLRDKIAIKAMAAIIRKAPFGDNLKENTEHKFLMIANGAYNYADAMLHARKTKHKPEYDYTIQNGKVVKEPI